MYCIVHRLYAFSQHPIAALDLMAIISKGEIN